MLLGCGTGGGAGSEEVLTDGIGGPPGGSISAMVQNDGRATSGITKAIAQRSQSHGQLRNKNVKSARALGINPEAGGYIVQRAVAKGPAVWGRDSSPRSRSRRQGHPKPSNRRRRHILLCVYASNEISPEVRVFSATASFDLSYLCRAVVVVVGKVTTSWIAATTTVSNDSFSTK